VTGTEFGFPELLAKGKLWVLSKFLARFSVLPKWNESFRVETWGRGVDKLPQPNAREPAATFAVRFSDLDVNEHVNSARYLSWALDSAPAEVQQRMELASFEINFVAEARLGDEVVVSAEIEKGVGAGILAGIRHQADGKELCRVRLAWR
jgi:hypothetical protein